MAVIKELENLQKLYHENKLSHAYLIETNNLTKTYEDLLIVVKNIICPHEYKESCNECNLCNLINNHYLPSLVTIEADGKNMKKEQILELKSRFNTLPIFTKENIYIIKEAEKLNASSANTMLKFLEEPEAHIIGFFLTNNINNVINTIKSRCEIIKVRYQEEKINLSDNPYYEVVKNYLEKIELEKVDTIMYNKTVLLNKYTEKEDFLSIFSLMLNIYRYFLNNDIDLTKEITKDFAYLLKLNKNDLLKKEEIMSKYIEDLNYNVNMELLLDRLVIELSDLYE